MSAEKIEDLGVDQLFFFDGHRCRFLGTAPNDLGKEVAWFLDLDRQKKTQAPLGCLVTRIYHPPIAPEKLPQPDKADHGKPRFDLLPFAQLVEVVDVFTYGASKYADNGWQTIDRATDRYFAAAMRHLAAWREGETNDEESGLSHLSHAICSLLICAWHEDQGDGGPLAAARGIITALKTERDALRKRVAELEEELEP